MSSRDVHEDYQHYSMLLQWDPEEDIYVVTVPELPGCMTHGATYEEAVRQGQDAVDSWIAANRSQGRRIPEPQIFVAR